MDPGFEILYEEGPCLVVCKPPGLPTQAPPGIDSLEVRVKSFLKRRDNPPHDVYLGVPHRLDRPASGAIVFATRRRAAHKLARQFEYREVQKLYWACVEGRPDPPAGTWQDYLRKVYGKPQAEVVPADHPEARLAVLHYRTLSRRRLGLVAGDRVGDRPHAPNPHPSGLARPSGAGRFPVRLEDAIRTAARRRTFAGDRPARTHAGVRASDDQAADLRHRAGAGVLAPRSIAVCGFVLLRVRIGKLQTILPLKLCQPFCYGGC